MSINEHKWINEWCTCRKTSETFEEWARKSSRMRCRTCVYSKAPALLQIRRQGASSWAPCWRTCAKNQFQFAWKKRWFSSSSCFFVEKIQQLNSQTNTLFKEKEKKTRKKEVSDNCSFINPSLLLLLTILINPFNLKLSFSAIIKII